MSNVIKPSVGRKIWYWRDMAHRVAYNAAIAAGEDYPSDQPWDASVCKALGDRLVNVTVADPNGVVFAKKHVPLNQPDEPAPHQGPHCSWMPFQQGQARAK